MEFVTDPQLLGLSLSPAQEALLRTIYGLPLSADQVELYRLCTGRQGLPAAPFGEVTVVAGTRAGKDSRVAAPIVCYEALFGGHERHVAKGERGVIVLVAQDLRGTKIAYGYIRAYLAGSPDLAAQLEDAPLAAELTLKNGLQIACFPCTVKSLRGWSVPVGVMDELGFYRLEGQADSDVEVETSIRRGMLTFEGSRLVKISTPYMKSGVLYEDTRRYFGQDDGDVLVWRAPSALMNPGLKAARLERERRRDPERYAREYEGEFAEDLETFLPAAWVEAAMATGRRELAPRLGVHYVAAVDVSAGGPDYFTLAVGHVEGAGPERRVVQDVMRGWRRRGSEMLDLQGVVRQIASLIRPYGLAAVVGDRYGGQWIREAFRAAGLVYRESEVDRSGAYLEVEPLFAQGRIRVLDHPELLRELKMLERRRRAGGKVLVDHPSGARHHDDHANALALAAWEALRSSRRRSGFDMLGRRRADPFAPLGPVVVEPADDSLPVPDVVGRP